MKGAVWTLFVSSSLLGLVGATGSEQLAIAQSTTPTCQPPQPGEYLLLAVSPTQLSREQLRRSLPASTNATLCRYSNDIVTRIAGFRSFEDANDWALYIKDIAGLSVFVVRPPEQLAPVTVQPASPRTAPATPRYNPQPLGNGYAVLVDYFNQPEIAEQVEKVLGNSVGLVSYGQRPYLLALYTTSQSTADSTLRRLSDRGFLTMIVDSRKVTLLQPQVSSR